MRGSSELDRLRRKWSKRGEDGAGALLPILVVGMIMVVISASIALAVSYSSNVSTAQIRKSAAVNNVTSLLNSFESDIYTSNVGSGTTNPQPTATIANVGSYKVYYSTATAAPTSTTSSGVVALPSASTIPTTAKWVLVAVTPQGGVVRNAVFSYRSKGSAVYDSAINWTGSVTLSSSSTIQNAPGVAGPVSVVGRESASTATTQGLSLSAYTSTAADVWSLYSTTKTSFAGSTLRGNLVSKSGVNYISSSKVFGDVTTSASAAQISGPVTQEGTTRSSVSSLPAAPGQQALRLALPTTVATLTAADCSTPALLKAKLESITSDGTVAGVNTCAAASWATTINPKANLLLRSTNGTENLNISNLTVAGPKVVSIQSQYGLSLNSVKYKDGAKGQFMAGNGTGATKINLSNLTGSVVNYGTGGGSVELAGTNLYYSPVDSNLCTNSATTSCTPISSTVPHLVRVS